MTALSVNNECDATFQLVSCLLMCQILFYIMQNSSVLENHHWRSAMGCLNESGVSSVLGSELVAVVEEQIKSLVLATDITRQQEFLTRLKVSGNVF